MEIICNIGYNVKYVNFKIGSTIASNFEVCILHRFMKKVKLEKHERYFA